MDKIKKVLEEKGKTQAWLARELKVSRPRMAVLLKQEDMMLSTAFKIADLLDIDVNEFRKEEPKWE